MMMIKKIKYSKNRMSKINIQKMKNQKIEY